MLKAAKYVYDELMEKHILDKAFSHFSDYGLVITGHSLGAGTAVILSFMLRDKFPEVKCYAYSPPGGLVDVQAAKGMCARGRVQDRSSDPNLKLRFSFRRVLRLCDCGQGSGPPSELPIRDAAQGEHEEAAPRMQAAQVPNPWLRDLLPLRQGLEEASPHNVWKSGSGGRSCLRRGTYESIRCVFFDGQRFQGTRRRRKY